MNTSWSCLRQQYFNLLEYSLVPIRHEFIEPIRRWRNSQLEVLRQAAPISPAQQSDYFSRNIWPTMNLTCPPNILMGLLINDRLIGYGGLVHISWEDRRAEMSFLVDNLRSTDFEQYERDFNAFISLIVDLTFNDLCFHKLFTETYANRIQHIQILESAGFKREGVLRDHVKIDNSYVDSIFHAFFAS